MGRYECNLLRIAEDLHVSQHINFEKTRTIAIAGTCDFFVNWEIQRLMTQSNIWRFLIKSTEDNLTNRIREIWILRSIFRSDIIFNFFSLIYSLLNDLINYFSSGWYKLEHLNASKWHWYLDPSNKCQYKCQYLIKLTIVRCIKMY